MKSVLLRTDPVRPSDHKEDKDENEDGCNKAKGYRMGHNDQHDPGYGGAFRGTGHGRNGGRDLAG